MTNNKIKPDIFINGKLINLVVLTDDLIESSNWYKWFNDETITENTTHHVYPNSKDLQKTFLKNEINSKKDKIQLGIYHIKDSILIGVISLNNIDHFHKNCEFSGMVGEPEYQTLKYYSEAARLIITHGFNTLGMMRVAGGTFHEDIQNMVCRVLGCKHEGVKRSAIYKNGKYNDVYIHSILREEFLALKIYNDTED